MKKLLSIAISSLALAAMAESSPTIGVTEITTTLTNTIISVPFTSLVDGSATSPSKIVKGYNLPAGTTLYIFAGNSYKAWALSAGKEWIATMTAGTVSGVSFAADTEQIAVPAGGAIWVSFPSVPEGGQKIYIYGQWTNIVEQTLVQGANLIANPLQTAGTISVSGAVRGDAIVVPKDTTAPDRYVYKGASGQPMVWVKSGVVGLPGNIPVGTGFWYVTTNATPGKVSWTVAN
jgi:hypothetical protein